MIFLDISIQINDSKKSIKMQASNTPIFHGF